MNSETKPITAIWTDFAGVLTPPLHQTMAVFCARTGIDPAALMPAAREVARGFGTDDIMLPVDTPLITEAEWLRRISDLLPADQRANLPTGTIADLWFEDRVANAEWVGLLRRLRDGGLFVGLLSNMMPSWDRHWRRMVPVDELFDEVILSFSAACRKPERAIYELATARAGVRPAEILFVDDTADNCAAATAAGWTAVHFTGTARAIADVEAVLAARNGSRSAL